MKKILSTILISVAMTPVMAQNIVDAGRFGTTEIAGTARYRSMAGAFGALGGDATCMNDNPAGIGIFRGNSQVTISPTLAVSRNKTDGSVSQKSKKSDLSISNLAYIISIRPEGFDRLVNFNIGLGLNHSEGVNRKYKMTMDNPRGSFGNYVAVRANNALRAANRFNDPGYLADDKAWDDSGIPLIALMGYDSFAIDDAGYWIGEGENRKFVRTGGVNAYNVSEGLQSYQRLAVREKNRMDEYNINLSANWDDTFYAGMTLSIVDYNSTILSDLYEDYDYNYEGDYTEYSNDLETQGSGVNVKLGVLWKATDALRLGLAVHTPTWYDMKDYYNGAMITNDPDCLDYSYANRNGAYEYRYKYQTPWEYQISAAYVVGTKGILSLEYDAKDFSRAKYTSANDYKGEYSGMNRLIKNNMQLQHTIKAGAEYRITNNLSLRAGYAFQTSPYKDNVLNDNLGQTGWSETYRGENYWGDDRTLMFDSSTKTNYSLLDKTQYICGGIGWAKGNWFFDFAVMDRIQDEVIAAYPTTQSVSFDSDWNASFSEGVVADHIDMKTHTLKYDLTIGYKF